VSLTQQVNGNIRSILIAVPRSVLRAHYRSCIFRILAGASRG